MNPHYDRGWLLFQRGRFDEAVPEMQQATADDPNDPFAHGLLALCLSSLDRHQQALEHAQRAIELAPDSDYGYFVLARVFTERQRLDEAFRAISTAIQLDPEDAMNQAWLARIEFERSNWNATVAAADAGPASSAVAQRDRYADRSALTVTRPSTPWSAPGLRGSRITSARRAVRTRIAPVVGAQARFRWPSRLRCRHPAD